MATSIGNDISNSLSGSGPVPTVPGDLLVCLPCMDRQSAESVIVAVTMAFPNASVMIAVADGDSSKREGSNATLVPYEDARSQAGWALHATDYVAAGNLARKHQKATVILLGSDAPSPSLLQRFADSLAQASADVILPSLHTGPRDGLVNSALLYPMTRALFGHDVRFPLAQNLALSSRAMERLAAEAQREVSAGRGDSLVWPVSAAAATGLAIRQIETDERLPVPQIVDFNRLFGEVIGSLLTDIELRAISWQRGRYQWPARQATPSVAEEKPAQDDPPADVVSMIEGFRVAHANLLPIWSLVLPPQALLALKKLALVPPQMFTFPPELWARIVYDFALAFHLRTINRNHLLGALTPLYLAWAASHILSAAGDAAEANRLVQQTAAAFEGEKAYFVSRWRWPDRFNP